MVGPGWKALAIVAVGAVLAIGAYSLSQSTAPGDAAPPVAQATGQAPAPAPATPNPAPSAPPAQPVTPPAQPAQQTPAAAAQSAPAAAQPAPGAAETAAESDPASAQEIAVQPRMVVLVRGAANWDDGFKAITTALSKARSAALKAGFKEAGRPLTAFVDTDDNGFKFEAMIPIEPPTGAAPDLGAEAKLGTSPSGKAIKFQHRGAYDDVDSTYEAITAYLDEKGYDAQNVFAEEYLNDPKGADDTGLALDIYVFIK